MTNTARTGHTAAQSALIYVRQSDLIGTPEVTPEQAEANRRAGKSPVRPRPGRPGMVPFSAATLWRKVAADEFPPPVKLSERVTAWPLDAVREWLDSRRA